MDRLVDAALAGTALAGDMPIAGNTPTAALVAQLPDLSPARQLLLAAGTQAIYARVGRATGPPIAAPEIAPPDLWPACSIGAAQLLDRLLDQDPAGILPEALARLTRAGQRLPHTLITAALATGKRQANLRPALLPVLDARGRWLASKNPDWAWAASAAATVGGELPADAETTWQEGAAPQRLTLLLVLRASDPARARTWLADVWKVEKADFRAQALAALDKGLSPDDEPFLEAALDDRSQVVRAEAARLLARLPTSALAGRMRERIDPLLGYTPHRRGLFRAVAQAFSGNAARGDLVVTLPDKLDQPWQRDGIEPKPRAGIGERAWWLMRALAAIAPDHWSARFAASPAELVAAAKGQEWGQAVIEGWTRAAIAARDAAWVPSLWRYWVDFRTQQQGGNGPTSELLRGLLDTMPPDLRTDVALGLLAEATHAERPLWAEIAPLLPTPWGRDLGQRYLAVTRERLRSFQMKYYDPWLPTLEIAARALPPETFAQAQADWRMPEGLHWSPHEWQRRLGQFKETIALRQRLREEISL